jgi:hypothetical protein
MSERKRLFDWRWLVSFILYVVVLGYKGYRLSRQGSPVPPDEENMPDVQGKSPWGEGAWGALI